MYIPSSCAEFQFKKKRNIRKKKKLVQQYIMFIINYFHINIISLLHRCYIIILLYHYKLHKIY